MRGLVVSLGAKIFEGHRACRSAYSFQPPRISGSFCLNLAQIMTSERSGAKLIGSARPPSRIRARIGARILAQSTRPLPRCIGEGRIVKILKHLDLHEEAWDSVKVADWLA
jgi:hypothetical protein